MSAVTKTIENVRTDYYHLIPTAHSQTELLIHLHTWNRHYNVSSYQQFFTIERQFTKPGLTQMSGLGENTVLVASFDSPFLIS